MKTLVAAIEELDAASLHPEELAHAATLSEVRRREYIAGRVALHRLLDDPKPILKDDRGAPVLPSGLVGSISHTRERVAALVAPDDGWKAGIDLERRRGLRYDIAKRILVPRELASLPTDPVEREASVLLHFSIKEAIYKAIDPFVRRYVGFQEVELTIADGAVTVRSEIPLIIEASYEVRDDHWLSIARARR